MHPDLQSQLLLQELLLCLEQRSELRSKLQRNEAIREAFIALCRAAPRQGVRWQSGMYLDRKAP